MTTIVSDGMSTWWNRPMWTERNGYLYGEVVLRVVPSSLAGAASAWPSLKP